MGKDCPTDTVCFHAQQCAEKYLKALLVWKGIPFPKTHDLSSLIAFLPKDLQNLLTGEEQELLTEYATVTRYPGGYEDITLSEARSAVKAGELFTTAVDNQQAVTIHVLQGERQMSADNWSLGTFLLEDIEPAPAGVPRIGVQFTIDVDGILHVLARDVNTGREKLVQMKSTLDVSKDAVEKMVRESIEHGKEDAAKKELYDARLEADKVLSATKKAMDKCGRLLEQEERVAIDRARSDLEEAIERNGAAGIKDFTVNLNKATERLASLLLEETAKEIVEKEKR